MRGHIDHVALTRHLPALDGLRALAVIAVIAFHLGWISGGFLGVDLFFVLSGFLITSLLLSDARGEGGIDLRAFWARRFRRLLPAVALTIGGVLAWLAVWGTAAEQANARDDARWAIPYLANWHLIAQARDYWATAVEPSVFTHLWSLAVEEQFYVLWPLVVWVLVRRGGPTRRLVWVTGALAAASWVALVVLHDPSNPSRVYLGTDTRAFALLLGALAALLPLARRPADRRSEAVAGLAMLGLCVLWVVGGDLRDWLLRGGLLVHSGLAVTLIALVAADRTWLGLPLGTRPLVWIGQRSYGLYLWHWPVLVLIRPRTPNVPAAVRDVIIIAISVALAELSYQWIEHPIRRREGWATGQRAARATAGLMLIAAVVALIAPSGRGHVASFDLASIAPVP
ncbi:MAG: acyltransferase family protein, partial [Ilumatobacteraceae bacterium]